MKNLLLKLLPILDVLLMPFIYPAALLLKLVRRVGVNRLRLCKSVLFQVGVFPIRRHYYEPRFDYRNSINIFSSSRNLSGLNLNVTRQLEFLEKLRFTDELRQIPLNKSENFEFYFNNPWFGSGDAEYWYQIIRAIKPKKIYEIGSGYSTLIALKALSKNKEENPNYDCEHICIEPFENKWLERLNIKVIRKKVEEVEISLFSKLQENDFLFIDSSHIINPRGDVLYEYLELLPSLNKGVVVQIHDIFTPKDYPTEWLIDEIRLWNEQYLLEAFLTQNNHWEVIGALNFLFNNYFNNLNKIAPSLTIYSRPSSFYIRKLV